MCLRRFFQILRNDLLETRDVDTICPEELDSLIAAFFIIIKRADGTELGVRQLSRYRAAINNFLKECDYEHDIIYDSLFNWVSRDEDDVEDSKVIELFRIIACLSVLGIITCLTVYLAYNFIL